ncbi:hypothetical protein FMUND_4851 [Fusarium mundagurra]|uniref:Uncharacterized protein n=1 Tax=Fusarium mundagurra TaxID=1567541 RepID=A0A8H5YV30_9HYPO|nr:hypothetical protein FMUND_4851 [Fusarium mundagurra]
MDKEEGESSGASKGKETRYGPDGKVTYVRQGPPSPPGFRWDQLDPKMMTCSDLQKIPIGAKRLFAAHHKMSTSQLYVTALRNQQRMEAGGEPGPAQDVFRNEDIPDLVATAIKTSEKAKSVNNNGATTKFDGNSNGSSQQDGGHQEGGRAHEDATANGDSDAEEEEDEQEGVKVSG